MEKNLNVSLLGISHRLFVKHICLVLHTMEERETHRDKKKKKRERERKIKEKILRTVLDNP
jgi:hypothetical protein